MSLCRRRFGVGCVDLYVLFVMHNNGLGGTIANFSILFRTAGDVNEPV